MIKRTTPTSQLSRKMKIPPKITVSSRERYAKMTDLSTDRLDSSRRESSAFDKRHDSQPNFMLRVRTEEEP